MMTYEMMEIDGPVWLLISLCQWKCWYLMAK